MERAAGIWPETKETLYILYRSANFLDFPSPIVEHLNKRLSINH